VLDDYSSLDHVLERIESFDGIVFGCRPGADAIARRLRSLRPGISPMSAIPVIAVGRDAADALERNAIFPTLRLDGACRDTVAANAPALSRRRLLLITSPQGRPDLKSELEALGATVQAAPAYTYSYRNCTAAEELPELIILPSSSAARLLLESDRGDRLKSIAMLAIGPVTEAAARDLGATDVKRCPTDSIESLVSGARELLCGRGPGAQDCGGKGEDEVIWRR
jgi:uroporphyrinogen III methyltransferase/synthase